MIFLTYISIFLSNWVITTAEEYTNGGYCDITSKTCDKHIENGDGKKFLFYDVNPYEGFNLRRDVYMRFAIMLSEAQKRGKSNWELVLPPWYNLYHWRTDKQVPTPWDKYFDIDSLRSYAPVVEMYETFKKTKRKTLEIDTLYVLENFEDAFENGVFEEKWRVVGECEYKGHFWGYHNITAKEIICVKFQGKISKLWELISLHPNNKKVMFAHGEIPLHDSYGTKSYWDCRKSMRFNKNLIKIAEEYISKHLDCDTEKCNSYISVHWRRQDFARSRGNDVPTIAGTVTQIKIFLKRYPHVKQIFVATDASISELNSLETQLTNSGYEIHFFMPSTKIIEEYGDGGVAIIDQIICSHSLHFIGTHESTFSYRIQEEREIMGFDSDTTFNRLCPDTGRCEKPSRWTIVN